MKTEGYEFAEPKHKLLEGSLVSKCVFLVANIL